MAVSAEKIKELLGNGLSNEVVATAVGVHPSYISQLMSDEVFASDVVSLRTQSLTAATCRDRSWDGVEDALLKKLAESVDSGMIYKPMDLLRALTVANGAKRRGSSSQQAVGTSNTIINLNLPVMVVNAYKKNIHGEVVEVTADGQQQTLVTMPASALMHKLAEQHQGNANYEQVRKYLPAGDKTAESKG